MPRFDLSDVKAVKLVITPETSQRIADLRSQFRKEGRDQDSLAYVVDQAVLLLHSQVFANQPRPADSDRFLRTDAKD